MRPAELKQVVDIGLDIVKGILDDEGLSLSLARFLTRMHGELKSRTNMNDECIATILAGVAQGIKGAGK